MGYEVERFVGIVNDGLLCCICRDVLQDPVQAPCEHAFCRECIHRWLHCERKCPEDRKPLSTAQLQPLHRYMKNDLMKLKLKCRHSQLGCQHISVLENISSHEETCEYDTVECPNDGCQRKMGRRDLTEHQKYCQFSVVECSNGCGISYVASRRSKHSCIAELRSIVNTLRADITSKKNEQNNEIDLRLTMQRSHMVQRETIIQSEIDDLRSENNKLNSKIKLLMEIGAQRENDIDKLQSDIRDIKNTLIIIQTEIQTKTFSCQSCSSRTRHPKVTEL